MRWKKKEKIKLQDGDIRTITRFLIFPKNINGETRFLEKASWVEKLHMDSDWDGVYINWEIIDWLENYIFDTIIL